MVNLPHITNKKYYNNHKVNLKNISRNTVLHYGDWGVIVCEEGVITPNQLETARCVMSKTIKHIGKLWIKILPDHIITHRPKDSRMGAGKGKPYKWVFVLRPGDVIFEATEISKHLVLKIFKLVKDKLPIKVKIIYKNDIYSN